MTRPVIHDDGFAGPVDRSDAPAEHGRDAIVGVVLVGADGQMAGIHLARQEVLREGRPVIGRRRLLADQQDAAIPPVGAKTVCDLEAGLGGADDDDRIGGHAPFIPEIRAGGGRARPSSGPISIWQLRRLFGLLDRDDVEHGQFILGRLRQLVRVGFDLDVARAAACRSAAFGRDTGDAGTHGALHGAPAFLDGRHRAACRRAILAARPATMPAASADKRV
jgi:hypothetical protein